MNCKQNGFSLIEIMVVVVILSILAALVVPKIINRPEEARIVKAKQDVLTLQNALELYQLDNGFYPSTEQGLNALINKPNDPPIPEHWSPYLKFLPKDPWGHAYLYNNPGEHGDIDIYTYGRTGMPNGKGQDAEIGNWNVQN